MVNGLSRFILQCLQYIGGYKLEFVSQNTINSRNKNNLFYPYLASSLSDIGIPLRRQKTSIGESPDASQIKFAFSPFLTDSRTVFSSKLGGAKTKLNRIIFPSIMFQTDQ